MYDLFIDTAVLFFTVSFYGPGMVIQFVLRYFLMCGGAFFVYNGTFLACNGTLLSMAILFLCDGVFFGLTVLLGVFWYFLGVAVLFLAYCYFGGFGVKFCLNFNFYITTNSSIKSTRSILKVTHLHSFTHPHCPSFLPIHPSLNPSLPFLQSLFHPIHPHILTHLFTHQPFYSLMHPYPHTDLFLLPLLLLSLFYPVLPSSTHSPVELISAPPPGVPGVAGEGRRQAGHHVAAGLVLHVAVQSPAEHQHGVLDLLDERVLRGLEVHACLGELRVI